MRKCNLERRVRDCYSRLSPSLVEGFRSSLHRAGDFHRTRRSVNEKKENENTNRTAALFLVRNPVSWFSFVEDEENLTTPIVSSHILLIR